MEGTIKTLLHGFARRSRATTRGDLGGLLDPAGRRASCGHGSTRTRTAAPTCSACAGSSVIAHGNSTATAIANAIRLGARGVEHRVVERLAEGLAAREVVRLERRLRHWTRRLCVVASGVVSGRSRRKRGTRTNGRFARGDLRAGQGRTGRAARDRRGRHHRRGLVPGGSGRRLARPRGADHGARGPVRRSRSPTRTPRASRPSVRRSTTSRRTSSAGAVAAASESEGLRALIDGAPRGAPAARLHARLVGRDARRLVRAARVPRRLACSAWRSRRSSTSASRSSPRAGWRRSARTSSRARAAPSSPARLGLGERLARRRAARSPRTSSTGSPTTATWSRRFSRRPSARCTSSTGSSGCGPAILEAFEDRIEYASRATSTTRPSSRRSSPGAGSRSRYAVLEVEGPPHERRFVCAAIVDGERVGIGRGQLEEGRRAGRGRARRSTGYLGE